MPRPLLVAALTLAAFLLRLAVLWTDEPLGTDGYYYVVQIEDLVAHGRLHVPDGSWTLRLLALPHVFGASPVASLAWMAALLAAAVVPAAAWTWPDRWAPALLLAASPTLTHLAADFPKSLGLAAPLVLLVGAAERRAWPLAALCALLAASAHRVGAVLALLVLVGALSSRLDARAWRGLMLLALGIGVFGLVATQVPGLLHPSDLERLSGQLRSTPWPPAPFAWPRALPWPERVELLAPWALLAFVPAGLRAERTRTLALLAALVPCLFPFWRADTLDLGYRLALWAPLLAWPLLRLPDERPLALLLPLSLWGVDPASQPPYDRWREVLAAVPEPRPELLITPPGMSFLYDHLTGAEAMAWAPEAELDRARIGRIVWGISPGEWASVAGPEHPDVVPLPHGYAYVREDLWEALLAAAEGDEGLRERVFDERNPTRARPASLLRGRGPARP